MNLFKYGKASARGIEQRPARRQWLKFVRRGGSATGALQIFGIDQGGRSESPAAAKAVIQKTTAARPKNHAPIFFFTKNR